jgi:hypothetical protein
MRFRIGLLGLLLGIAMPSWGGELDRSFAVGGGGKLVIALDFGSLALHSHDGDTLRIEALSRGVGASGVHFDAYAEGEDVFFQGDAEPWLAHLHSSPGVRVKAWVPRGTTVMLSGRGQIELREFGGVQVFSP